MEIKYSNLISNTSPYAFAEIDKKVAELKKNGVKVIDFGVGDPISPSPSFVINALSASAEERKSSGYPSYIGDIKFRTAAAQYMRDTFAVDLDPDTEISSSIGSKEAIFNFPLGFINPGDLVICPSPGYPVYKTGTQFAGATPYFVPLLERNNFLIDLDSIPKDIASKAKIIWTNYPNSPTGVSAPKEWLKKLIDWAQEHEIIIAADEGCYIEIYFGKERPSSILEFGRQGIITFYSLSKRNNMTSYRVGFVAGDRDIISGFKKVKTNIDSGTPTIIQDVAVLALQDREHVATMRQEYAEKRALLFAAFAAVGFPTNTADSTFYLWQRAENMTGIELAQRLVEIGIVVTPGANISETINGRNTGADFVRFALVPSIAEVEEAAQRIKDNFRL